MMSESFELFFESPQGYTVWIDVDQRVAYAYFMNNEGVIGDVWLFNRCEGSATPEWESKIAEPPFINTKDNSLPFDKASSVKQDDFRVTIRAKDDPVSAGIYFQSRLIAILKAGESPGRSAFAKEPSILANPLEIPPLQQAPLT
jgi:hypothetical protein